MPDPTSIAPVIRAPRIVGANDPALRFPGAVSVERYHGWATPWRVPYLQRDLYLPDRTPVRAAYANGVRIAFRTDSEWLACRYRAHPAPEMGEPAEQARLDICCDERLTATVDLDADAEVRTFRADLPPGMKRVELWLPCYNRFDLRALELAPGALAGIDAGPRRPWVHYGSSISNGRGAASPSRAWHALLARSAGSDSVSIGLGGVCHLQPMFARLMRDLPATLLTVCVGINVCKYGTHNWRSYSDALIGFLQIVREGHPHTPLVVMSAIHSPRWEEAPGPAGMTLPQYRELTDRAVAALRGHGDRNLHYIDGTEVIGPDDEHLMLEPAGIPALHLGPRGHWVFASRFRRRLAALGVLPAPAGQRPLAL
ncbi:SGNH/GDSL hydrolase family protein [Nocardia sp. NPDC088792]|uniref:SGNH/GDSL hydrolase family protein n=1 Tax=Nocardia sp. NPDC088792 TaxID=3364332 RepID=UPI0037FC3FE5